MRTLRFFLSLGDFPSKIFTLVNNIFAGSPQNKFKLKRKLKGELLSCFNCALYNNCKIDGMTVKEFFEDGGKLYLNQGGFIEWQTRQRAFVLESQGSIVICNDVESRICEFYE